MGLIMQWVLVVLAGLAAVAYLLWRAGLLRLGRPPVSQCARCGAAERMAATLKQIGEAQDSATRQSPR